MARKKPAVRFKQAPYPKTAAQGKVTRRYEDGSKHTSTGNTIDAETGRVRRTIRTRKRK